MEEKELLRLQLGSGPAKLITSSFCGKHEVRVRATRCNIIVEIEPHLRQ
jgi:hypothetical protein